MERAGVERIATSLPKWLPATAGTTEQIFVRQWFNLDPLECTHLAGDRSAHKRRILVAVLQLCS